ncbi:unnamed protein product, partial [marine sediment metagenome]
TKEGKVLLNKMIKTYGRYKYIQIIGWNGELKYFRVLTKQIITQGIKAQDLLSKKYGKEISQQEFQEKTK